MSTSGAGKELATSSEGKTAERWPMVEQTVSTANQPPNEAIRQEQPDSAELMILVRQDGWIEVVDSRGEILVAELERTGEALCLHGHAPFDVVLGNPSGVTLSYAGQLVELPNSGHHRLEFKVGE